MFNKTIISKVINGNLVVVNANSENEILLMNGQLNKGTIELKIKETLKEKDDYIKNIMKLME